MDNIGLSDLTKKVSFCFAILGNTSQSLEDQILEIGTSPLTIHRIPFIDAMEHQEWLTWMELTLKLKDGVGIGVGAAGCAIGHREAWKTFQHCNHDYLVVLEDDAQFSAYGKKYFSSVLQSLDQSNLRLVHLGDHIQFNLRVLLSSLIKIDIREILRLFIEQILLRYLRPRFAYNQFPFSGHAYVIKRELAEIALAEINIFLFPIDVLLNAISQVPRNLVARIRTPLIVQSNLRESHIKIRGR